MPGPPIVLLKLAGLLDRQIEREHAVHAGLRRLPRELRQAQAQQRIGVAEDDDRRGDERPDLRDQLERGPQAPARRKRALRRALNHRAVGQRIRKRHADLEHVGAGAIERPEQLRRPREVRDRRPSCT